jgi:hypothetical protein
LLGSQEGDNGVRSDTEVVGGETSPETGNTLTGNRLLEAVHDGLVRKDNIGTGLLLLDLGLDVVEGEGCARGGDTGEHGGNNLDLELRVLGSGGGELLSDGIVRDEHGHVESGGSGHGGHSSLPKSSDSFLGGGTLEGIENTVVVSALSLGESRVGLHADEGEIHGVSDEGSETSSSERGTGFLENGGVTTVVLLLEVLNQVEVDTKSEGTVDNLSQKSSIDSLVEFLNTTVSVDLLDDRDGRGAASSFSSELETDLNHIHRLDERSSSAGSEGTSEEVEVEVHFSV